MIELKLEAYDKYEVVYSWKGLTVTGRNQGDGEYTFIFPEMDQLKAMKLGVDTEYVLRRYKIPTYGQSIHTFFKNEAKKELEEVLEKELSLSLNKRILIIQIFEDIVVKAE